MEPRQFVYIDDEAVRSLLASHSIAAPETVREKSEQVTEDGAGIDFGVGLDLPGFGSADVGADFSQSEVGRGVYEASRKVNEQYLFNILYETLDEEDVITDLTQGVNDYSLSNGDIIKIRGRGRLDATYRLVSILEYFYTVTDDEQAEQFTQAREVAYGGKIGMKIQFEDSISSFAMLMEEENLWVDHQRELMQEHEYVVLGRVREIIDGDEKWDYADILRLGSTIVSEKTMETGREMISEFISSIGDFRQTVDVPDFAGATMEDFQNEDFEQTESTIELDIDDEELVLDGPAFVIQPVAVYW
jgi:hypothetical protein